MNAREQRLALIFLTMLAVGCGWGWYLLVGKPLGDLKDRLANVQADIDKKENEVLVQQTDIKRVLTVDPRLKEWRKLSLPDYPKLTQQDTKNAVSLAELQRRHASNLQSDYEKYLSDLLVQRNGFTSVASPTPMPPDTKTGGALPDKRPMYTLFSFSVKGQGSYDRVVRMLEDFHRAPMLHQIRQITLKTSQPGRPQRGGAAPGVPGVAGAQMPGAPGMPGLPGMPANLEVTMKVEALMVTGAETREGLAATGLATQPVVLADPKREYAAMLEKNIFTGATARMTEDREQVLAHVRLTMRIHNGRRWEVSLWDQNVSKDVKWLNAKTVDTFTIRDRFQNILVDGKVVHIDEDGMVFKANDKYYRMREGDYMATSLMKPLKDEELKSLGLTTAQSEENKSGTQGSTGEGQKVSKAIE